MSAPELPVAAWTALVSVWLVLPKLLLAAYANARTGLWVGTRWSGRAFLQDLVLAASVSALLTCLLIQVTPLRLAIGALVTTALLVFLMLDCRVRQLFQSRIDARLLRYTLAHARDVGSGGRIFFAGEAGFGLRFRTALLAAAGCHALAWAAASAALLGRDAAAAAGAAPPEALPAAGILLVLALLGLGRPRLRMGLEENPVVAPLVEALRGAASRRTDADRAAEPFELTERPVARCVEGRPRRLLPHAGAFRDVVFVVFESVRWVGLGLDGRGPRRAPNLRRMAQTGLLARCRVGMPHTAKSYYSLLTGRHPLPGIEGFEGLATRHPSLAWEMRERRAASCRCLSSMPLAFERQGDLLRACGIEYGIEMAQVARRASRRVAAVSSFGTSDELLAEHAASALDGADGPHVVLLLPLAAHYPYVFPGKSDGDGDGVESYWRSVAAADALLPRLVDGLGRAGLGSDALWVLLGDHGESFDEHGSRLHNNSLFEEEVAAPLVFWSADGRLRTDGVHEARLIDVAPTTADLLGLCDATFPVQGESLLRRDRPGPAYGASFFDGVARSLTDGATKYVHLPASGDLLRIDLRTDPHERAPVLVGEGDVRRAVLARLGGFDADSRMRLARMRAESVRR